MTDDEPALLMSDHMVAALLGFSRATVWRNVAAGRLPPPIKIGGLTRWRRPEVLAAIDRAAAERDEALAAVRSGEGGV